MMDLHLPLFRAFVVMRVVLVVLAIGVNLSRIPELGHPQGLVAMCLVMVGMTVWTAMVYPVERRRRMWVFVVDVAVTVALVLVSPLVMGAGTMGGLAGSVPSYWAVTAPLAVSLWRGWLSSSLATAAVVAAGLVVADTVDVRTVAESIVVALACVSVGWFTSRLRTTTREREQMYAVAAGMAERQRLARIVHDGVLQVLAMVEREGRALGPRGQRLARAAHDQEGQLRALLQDTDIDLTTPDSVDATQTNLSVILDKYAGHGVSIATPPDLVMVESSRAREIEAAVSEALTNVRKHAGPNAQAWVLLEWDDNDLIISIRDNGVGGTPEEFAAAGDRGRMGMRHSIHGRLADLGGTATLRTAPGRGTEWEFRVPVSG